MNRFGLIATRLTRSRVQFGCWATQLFEKSLGVSNNIIPEVESLLAKIHVVSVQYVHFQRRDAPLKKSQDRLDVTYLCFREELVNLTSLGKRRVCKDLTSDLSVRLCPL